MKLLNISIYLHKWFQKISEVEVTMNKKLIMFALLVGGISLEASQLEPAHPNHVVTTPPTTPTKPRKETVQISPTRQPQTKRSLLKRLQSSFPRLNNRRSVVTSFISQEPGSINRRITSLQELNHFPYGFAEHTYVNGSEMAKIVHTPPLHVKQQNTYETPRKLEENYYSLANHFESEEQRIAALRTYYAMLPSTPYDLANHSDI